LCACVGRSSTQTDYTIHGTQQEKVFNALGAVAAILVCNTSGLLPEIQVGNMDLCMHPGSW
jgi:hypothetical protein